MNYLNHPKLFTYYSAENPKAILSIPHSGMTVPLEFSTFLNPDHEILNEDLDYKVNELIHINELNQAGICVLVSHIHRVCIDLNRARSIAFLAWPENTHGNKIVINQAPQDTQELLLAKYYDPFYEFYKSVINELKQKSSNKLNIIDLHSMPSKPTAFHLKKNPTQALQRPDFCLSDLDGKSCDIEYINHAMNIFNLSHQANKNDPYKGGYVTQYVSQFNVNTIQIEINRKLYMDEKRKELEKGLKEFKKTLTSHLIRVFDF